MRYKDVNATEPTKWMVTATKIEKRNGVKIPVANNGYNIMRVLILNFWHFWSPK